MEMCNITIFFVFCDNLDNMIRTKEIEILYDSLPLCICCYSQQNDISLWNVPKL